MNYEEGEVKKMIKVVLLDDDGQCAKTVKEFIARYKEDNHEEIELKWYTNGLDFMDEYKHDCDVVFMDIEMPHINGIETARKLRELDPSVPLIFMTVMAQLAIKGYEVDAMDFMVKPITYFNFSLKLQKALAMRKRDNSVILRLIGDDGSKLFITSTETYYVESMAHKCIFHTKRGVFYRYMSISVLEETLEACKFLRCNNSFLVNPAYITKINNNSVIVNDEELPISRAKKKEFMEKVTAYFKFVY